jgi:membrane-bound serine protease (ClpP class)
MAPDATLGGPGAKAFDRAEQENMLEPIKTLASDKERSWSLMAALIDPQVKVFRYTHQGRDEVRFLSQAEAGSLPDAAKWQAGSEVETRQGLKGRVAEELRLARYLAGNYDELKQLYHLEHEPASLQPNWAHDLVERLASPQLAGILLFLAWFFLFIEFMQPGLSIAGFISGLCFLLFFWSQFLHGTAGWLEVLLFLGGMLCVAIELFVTPGSGVFGVGGGALIIVSIVLASQTFIIPRNSYQLEQLPYSLATVLAGMAGGVTSLVLMRRFLPNAPLFKRMMLKPPAGEQLDDLDRRESLVAFHHLHGKRGVTITQLTPSGKARFGDDLVDVISNGELIPRGTDIYVTEVLGNRVQVRAIEPGRLE